MKNRMKVFPIEITEILSMVVEQAANTQEEAVRLVSQAYDASEIILGPEACNEVTFQAFQTKEDNYEEHN